MATPTYTAIASITLGSSASSVTFSSLPQGFRDLVLVISGQQTNNGDVNFYFNSDTGSNYSRIYMLGDGSGTSTLSTTSSTYGYISATVESSSITQIMDYSATDKHKTVLNRSDLTNSFTIAQAGRWANTAAITSIELDANSTGTFDTGCTFALWGIAS